MTTTETSSPQALAASIQATWRQQLERRRRRSAPHTYVYASAYRTCVRRMRLELSDSEKLPPLPVEVLAKFERANDRERELLIDLQRVGREADPPFTVIGQQERFTVRGRKGQVIIVGKVDARLNLHDGRSAMVEVKAWSPTIVERVETFADLFTNPWTRPGAYQILAYLYASGEPFGFMLLDRAGLPLLLLVELEPHFAQMEDFLTRAEIAVDHLQAGTLPDFLVGDAAECRRCPFLGSVCNPPLSHPAATVITDPDLEALLERRHALSDAAHEYERIDKDVKARLRGVEHGVAGPFAITGTWGKQSRIELPAALKAQYTKTDPRGRFTLEIVRL